VRRIFTMDLPPQGHTSSYSQQQHGGQILFRPSGDGYLYLMTGHYGEFSSNMTTSFLGKIVRFNIDDNMNGKCIIIYAVHTGRPNMFSLPIKNLFEYNSFWCGIRVIEEELIINSINSLRSVSKKNLFVPLQYYSPTQTNFN
jgi:hypothetical protein